MSRQVAWNWLLSAQVILANSAKSMDLMAFSICPMRFGTISYPSQPSKKCEKPQKPHLNQVLVCVRLQYIPMRTSPSSKSECISASL